MDSVSKNILSVLAIVSSALACEQQGEIQKTIKEKTLVEGVETKANPTISKNGADGPTPTPEIITELPAIVTSEDSAVSIPFVASYGAIALTCTSSSLIYASSNTDLVSASDAIVWSGIWPNCIAAVTPVTDAAGSSDITITLSDGSLTAARTFAFTVTPVNDAPTISAIASQSGYPAVATGGIPFTIADVDTSLDCATSVTATSSNTTLLPITNITFSGTMPDCTVNMTSASAQSGTSHITLAVSDGTLSAQQTFDFSTKTVPSVTSVSPTSGYQRGGGTLTITGTNLAAAPSVVVDGVTCTNPILASATTVTCTLPAGIAGSKDVVVNGPWNVPLTLSGAYTYVPMTIAVNSPNSGNDTYTDETAPVLSGTCSADVASLTLSPSAATFTNACSTTGTWQVTAPLGWNVKTFTVTASDGAGHTASDSIKITRTVVLGKNSYDAADSGSASLGYYSSTLGMRVWTNGTKLAVVDSPRHRVLLFNSIPASSQTLPDAVVGQTALNRSASGCTSSGLNTPTDVFYDGTRLWVADYGNHRVLAFTGWPSAHGTAASLVLGQPDLTTCTSATTAAKLKNPMSVWSNGTDVAVADFGNNRVVLWTGGTAGTGVAANRVLGQAGLFTTATAGRTSGTLSGPNCAGSDGARFFVCDGTNQRFLIWDVALPLSAQVADRVLGATNMTTVSTDTSVRIGKPGRYAIDGSRLYVSDLTDHAVRVYDSYATISSGAAATLVLGQSDFANAGKPNCGSADTSASCLRYPDGLAVGGGKLFVGDFGNARVMIWNTSNITTNGVAAASVYGKSDTAQGAKYVGAGLPLSGQTSVALSATKMAVVDRSNKRVLLYNTIPQLPYETPSVVLGQNSLLENQTYSAQQNSLPDPFGVATDGTRLFVSDFTNNRILVWISWPTQNNQNADYVLGQPNFTTNASATSQTGLKNPAGLALVNNKLAVADSGNNRILIYDVSTISDTLPAERVLGQADFTSSFPNRNTTAANNSLKGPYAVALTASWVAVADTGNNRALYWSSWPALNGAAASNVLGQATYSAVTANRGTTVSLSTLSGPKGVSFLDSKLFIADTGSNRILGWNDVSTITDGLAASFSLGHFTETNSASGNALSGAQSLASNGTKLAAIANAGVVMWNSAPTVQSTAPDFASLLGLIETNRGDTSATRLSEKWIRTQVCRRSIGG